MKLILFLSSFFTTHRTFIDSRHLFRSAKAEDEGAFLPYDPKLDVYDDDAYDDDDDDDNDLDDVAYEGEDAPYEDDEFEEDEGMSSSWAREDIEEEEHAYRDPYDEDEEERLSAEDIEQLVEKYLTARKRADDLEGENAKLTQQLMEISQGQAPETLVIQVSPEMW